MEAYIPVREAALRTINARQTATGVIENVTERDILRVALVNPTKAI